MGGSLREVRRGKVIGARHGAGLDNYRPAIRGPMADQIVFRYFSNGRRFSGDSTLQGIGISFNSFLWKQNNSSVVM